MTVVSLPKENKTFKRIALRAPSGGVHPFPSWHSMPVPDVLKGAGANLSFSQYETNGTMVLIDSVRIVTQ